MPKPTIQDSEELKALFNQELRLWKERTHATLEHLADLCGVTASYLSLVGRYGRVPSKAVLILLALNFQMKSPKDILRAARLEPYWPYPEGASISVQTPQHQRFLSISLDMEGLSNNIREIVRSELRPKKLSDVLGGRSLKFGININQSYLTTPIAKHKEHFTSSLIKQLRQHLQHEITSIETNHTTAFEQLGAGTLDIFGPVHTSPRRIGLANYTAPIAKVQVAALWRKKAIAALPELPKPRTWNDVKMQAYIISVLNKSSEHELALSRLQIPPSNLLIGDSPLECLERITLKNAARGAHLMIVDAPIATKIAEEFPQDVEVLFIGDENPFHFEIAIAVRPDWPEVASQLSETLSMLTKDGTIKELLTLSPYQKLLDCPR